MEWKLGKARENSAGLSQGTSGTGYSTGAALGCGKGSHAAVYAGSGHDNGVGDDDSDDRCDSVQL